MHKKEDTAMSSNHCSIGKVAWNNLKKHFNYIITNLYTFVKRFFSIEINRSSTFHQKARDFFYGCN